MHFLLLPWLWDSMDNSCQVYRTLYSGVSYIARSRLSRGMRSTTTTAATIKHSSGSLIDSAHCIFTTRVYFRNNSQKTSNLQGLIWYGTMATTSHPSWVRVYRVDRIPHGDRDTTRLSVYMVCIFHYRIMQLSQVVLGVLEYNFLNLLITHFTSWNNC